MTLIDNTKEFVETYNKKLWLGYSKGQNDPYCNAAESDILYDELVKGNIKGGVE